MALMPIYALFALDVAIAAGLPASADVGVQTGLAVCLFLHLIFLSFEALHPPPGLSLLIGLYCNESSSDVCISETSLFV